MAIHESGEMYLETIYILKQSHNMVRAIDVSEEMGFSKPSVSRALKLLIKQGYIEVDTDGSITLTREGKEIANKMFERHTMLTKALVALGISEDVAQIDACKIEHDLSDESFDAIKAHLSKFNIK